MGPNEVLDKSILVTRATPLFHVVELTDVEAGGVVTAAGAAWVGVAQEGTDELDVANGRIFRIRAMGISPCIADGAIPINTVVFAAADGRVTATAPGTGVTQWQVGITRTPAAAAGDHVSVQLTPGVRVTGA